MSKRKSQPSSAGNQYVKPKSVVLRILVIAVAAALFIGILIMPLQSLAA